MSDSSGVFGSLPEELPQQIFSYLEADKLDQLAGVNRFFRRHARDELLWKRLAAQHFYPDQIGSAELAEGETWRSRYVALMKKYFEIFRQIFRAPTNAELETCRQNNEEDFGAVINLGHYDDSEIYIDVNREALDSRCRDFSQFKLALLLKFFKTSLLTKEDLLFFADQLWSFPGHKDSDFYDVKLFARDGTLQSQILSRKF